MSILYHALTPHRLNHQPWRTRYGIFLDLSTRVLEVTPTFSSYSHHSPLTLNFYFSAITTCLRIPQCDLHLTRLNPRQRRIALLQSSLTHRCKHCIGHTCLLGDVFRGSQYRQTVRRGGWSRRVRRVEGGDELIRDVVTQVCAIPGGLHRDTKARFLRMFGRKGYDELTSMVAFMGWLNFVMGSLGFPLESRVVPFATLLLREEGVDVTIDDAVAEDGEGEVGRGELEYVTGEEAGRVGRRVCSQVENVARVLALVPSVVRATLKEREMFRGLPRSVRHLDEYAAIQFGCLPGFVRDVKDAALKRAVMFGAREVFIKAEQTVWTRWEKVAFLYVFARRLGNEELVKDSHMIACGCEGDGLSAMQVEQRLEMMYHKVSEAGGEDAFFAAARFVYECAGMAEIVSDEAQKRLLDKVGDMASVVDVVGCIGYFGFIHRIVVFRRT